jgi:hypothetical protein
MVHEKVEEIIVDVDNLIFEICEKYDITTISAVAAISARLFAITKEEYPEHDAIELLDKLVDTLMDVIECSFKLYYEEIK